MPFLTANPVIGSILMGMSIARLVFKPTMALVRTFVEATPYDSDDKWLTNTEQSLGYKALASLLDWTTSIKLPERPKAPPAFEVK